MFFSPLAMLLVMVFFFVVVFLFVVVQINIIALAFTEIGIPAHYIFTALLATLIGSFINIPVKTIPNDMPFSEKRSVRFYGFSHTVPAWRRKETRLAVNVGGAVIPVLLSAYLLLKTGLWGKAAVATLFMIWLTSRLARPLKGVGIALFGPYLLGVELASMVLLAGLVGAYHLGRRDRPEEWKKGGG